MTIRHTREKHFAFESAPRILRSHRREGKVDRISFLHCLLENSSRESHVRSNSVPEWLLDKRTGDAGRISRCEPLRQRSQRLLRDSSWAHPENSQVATVGHHNSAP